MHFRTLSLSAALLTLLSLMGISHAGKPLSAALPDKFGDIQLGMLLQDAAELGPDYSVAVCDEETGRDCLMWTDTVFDLPARIEAVTNADHRIWFIRIMIDEFIQNGKLYPCHEVYESMRDTFKAEYGKPFKKRGAGNWIWDDGDTEIQVWDICYGDRSGLLVITFGESAFADKN